MPLSNVIYGVYLHFACYSCNKQQYARYVSLLSQLAHNSYFQTVQTTSLHLYPDLKRWWSSLCQASNHKLQETKLRSGVITMVFRTASSWWRGPLAGITLHLECVQNVPQTMFRPYSRTFSDCTQWCVEAVARVRSNCTTDCVNLTKTGSLHQFYLTLHST
jgi:hypothetical protein